MAILSTIFRVLVGALFGALSSLALMPALAALTASASATLVQAIFAGFIVVGGLLGLLTSSLRRSFGWGFLALGLCTFALPLSMMLLAGMVTAEMAGAASAADQGATLLGAGIGGGLMTGAAAIVGFFLGAIFLIIALVLLLGGRREVILVDRASGAAVRGVASGDGRPALRRSAADRRIEPPLS